MKAAVKRKMIYSCNLDTPLGAVTAASENGALTGLWFVGQKHFPISTATWISQPDSPVFKLLKSWILEYFAGTNSFPGIRLEPQGTPFQKAVWDILLKIPYGQVTTYGQIAREIAAARGLPAMSARAVGSAVGRNPISLLIPCHRVVGAKMNLTGYAGGLDRKKALLQMEHAAI
jgi:methylated-DNA-[protein]-cysteine S-methyltransferase